MKDLTSPKWIVTKGILFFFLGVLSAMALLLADAKLKKAVLLAVTVWAFCRFYYFLFYVIERYVDPSFRFHGIWSLAVYLARKRGQHGKSN